MTWFPPLPGDQPNEPIIPIGQTEEETPEPEGPVRFVAAAHADDEPKGDLDNGDPCPVCGAELWYERKATGLPMRWVHRDETPRCKEDAP